MIPTRIGQKMKGGYFAGFVRDKQIRAVYVAPKTKEYTARRNNVPRICFIVDRVNGMRATTLLPDWSIYRNFALKADLNGYKDWYIPAIHELSLCYKNFSAGEKKVAKPNECTVPKQSAFLNDGILARHPHRFKTCVYISSSIIEPKQEFLSSIAFGDGNVYHQDLGSRTRIYLRPVRSEVIV